MLFGYLAVILAFILEHLLDVEAAGQVALGQVVAKLRDAQQPGVDAHALSVEESENRNVFTFHPQEQPGQDLTGLKLHYWFVDIYGILD